MTHVIKLYYVACQYNGKVQSSLDPSYRASKTCPESGYAIEESVDLRVFMWRKGGREGVSEWVMSVKRRRGTEVASSYRRGDFVVVLR